MASEHAPELLRADREQLDRAAALLGGEARAFVIAVCPKDLVAAAREHLTKQAGLAIPEPVVLQGSEEALEALAGTLPEVAGAKVRSLGLAGDAKEALRALNWHREKVLKGAPVVLWIDGVDGLTEMREAAPDAYAFRDMVVMVRGDGGRLPQIARKESSSILEARRRLARASGSLERAEAYSLLSELLRVHGHLTEAENVARRGLETLPAERFVDEKARLARAWLWVQVAAAASERGSRARQRQAAQQGFAELEGVPLAVARERRIWLLDIVPGPHAGRDRSHTEEAFALTRHTSPSLHARIEAVRMFASVMREVGDLDKARDLLAQIAPLPLDSINKSMLALDLAATAAGTGRMHDIELRLQEAMSMRQKEHARFAMVVYASANCWLEKGELDTAEKVINHSLEDVDPTDRCYKTFLLAGLALARGNMELVGDRARVVLRDAARFALDKAHIDASGLLADIATEAHDADRLGYALHKVAAELEVEEDVSRAITNNDPPPWYPIRFLGYRAALLIRTDRRAEALDLARRALDLARATYPDLIPETGRALADHLLRAGNPDEALPLLAGIEPEAVSRGMLKELARIRAARVLAFVLLNEPPTAVDPAIAALREALESTGAPRIRAEILQELAIRLPPATMLPDPLALASETHALFVEMPMPAKEARSLELAGDVLAARGKPADARRRYLTARGILERRGLGLRLPLLAAKIEKLA
jgi:tetratricopeptide (TPR) repeat protein